MNILSALLGGGKSEEDYHVTFDWEGVELETSVHVEASSKKEALEQAQAHIDLPEGTKGKWHIKRD
jgi:hypothetical protein